MVSEEKQGIWHAIWMWFYCKVLGHEYTWREEWAKFYRKVFGLKVDLSGVTLPAEQEGFDCVVVLAKELGDKPISVAIAAAKKLFKIKGREVAVEDAVFDKYVPFNDRDLKNGSYAIRIRASNEAVSGGYQDT